MREFRVTRSGIGGRKVTKIDIAARLSVFHRHAFQARAYMKRIQ